MHTWTGSNVVREIEITDHTGDALTVESREGGKCAAGNGGERCIVAIVFNGGGSVHLDDPDRRALIVALGGMVADA